MAKQQTATMPYKDTALEKLKHNYQSILLGLLVVIIGISFLTNLPLTNDKAKPGKKGTVQEQLEKQLGKNRYRVKRGDNLWSISERYYASGYNWTDVAKANKLANPDRIEVGQVLVIPSVKPGPATVVGQIAEAKTQEVTIKGTKYSVRSGDSLWSIALAAYGDPYEWHNVAKNNNLNNPDIIHKGNVIKLPR